MKQSAEAVERPDNDSKPGQATEAFARQLAALALQAKASDPVILGVRELVHYTDWFVIVSGRSDRHVHAIWQHVKDGARELGRRPTAVEGVDHGQWVLVDFGDVVVHVFYEPVRGFYELERLWAAAPALTVEELPDDATAD